MKHYDPITHPIYFMSVLKQVLSTCVHVFQASYGGVGRSYQEVTAYRHYSRSNKFISVQTSTEQPKVTIMFLYHL